MGGLPKKPQDALSGTIPSFYGLSHKRNPEQKFTANMRHADFTRKDPRWRLNVADPTGSRLITVVSPGTAPFSFDCGLASQGRTLAMCTEILRH